MPDDHPDHCHPFAGMSVVEITSKSHFDQVLKGPKSNELRAINFYTEWAAPCQQMNAVFEELSTSYPSTVFLQVNAEEIADVAEDYEVSAVPFVVLERDGKVLHRLSGADTQGLSDALARESIRKAIPPALPTNGPVSTEPEQEEETEEDEDLDTRLKRLTTAAPVMLFMKGTPAAPQCGFSRQLVGLLRERSVRYGFFNILADDDVRQGLKEFSDWPTFPQLYVDGELVGGLDIVREMMETGEWDTLLTSQTADDTVAGAQ